jgi:hypothetical protein
MEDEVVVDDDRGDELWQATLDISIHTCLPTGRSAHLCI